MKCLKKGVPLFIFIICTMLIGRFIQGYILNSAETVHAESISQNQHIIITEIAATEISSHEWIEIKNVGNTTVDLESWKFVEADVNHGLNLYSGSFKLRSQEIALIANNAENVALAHQLTNVTVLDSSWGSLKLDGEEIGLRNSEGDIVELFTYLPHSEDTLQRVRTTNDYSESNWITAPTSPGRDNLQDTSPIQDQDATPDVDLPATPDINQTNEPTPDAEQDTSEPQTPDIENTTNQSVKPTAIIYIQSGSLTGDEKVTVNLDGTRSLDPQDEKISYYWNYGDGYIYENKNPPSHTFREPGTYIITLRVTNESGLSDQTSVTATVHGTEKIEAKTTEKNTQKKTEETDKSKSTTSEEPEKNKVEPEKSDTPSKPTSYPTLLLNEIFPNPTGRDNGLEWVEIFNPNSETVNINGYILDDLTNAGSKPMTLGDVEILPRSYYLIYDPSINLNNSDEEIQLLDPNEKLLDKIYFSKSIEGQSLSRVEGNWLWTSSPSPNLENLITSDTLEISEKKTESSYQNGNLSSEIYITEILPNPKGEDAKGEWIELYNAGTTDINLGNWQIDDNEKGSKPYVIPDSTLIKANSFTIIPRNDSKISLDNKGDSVRLFNFEEELQDEITYENAKENTSFAKIKLVEEHTNEETWLWTPSITKSDANPTLYRVQGEVTSKEENKVRIKDIALTVPQQNELIEIVFSIGNILEVTYNDKFEIKEYKLLREALVEDNTSKNTGQIKDLIVAILLIGGYAFYKHKRGNKNPKNVL